MCFRHQEQGLLKALRVLKSLRSRRRLVMKSMLHKPATFQVFAKYQSVYQEMKKKEEKETFLTTAGDADDCLVSIFFVKMP